MRRRKHYGRIHLEGYPPGTTKEEPDKVFIGYIQDLDVNVLIGSQHHILESGTIDHSKNDPRTHAYRSLSIIDIAHIPRIENHLTRLAGNLD